MTAMDLVGRRFGRLVVTGRAPSGPNWAVRWFVRCDCGTEKTVNASSFKSTKSCGCWRAERGRNMLRTHGEGGASGGHAGRTTEFVIWSGMIQRCTDPNVDSYKYYGARGIRVCERWLKFENFLADMGRRFKGMSLDRWPNMNGNYEPGNCRWATHTEQMNNRRNNRRLTWHGVTRTVAEWGRHGRKQMGIYRRLYAGKSIGEALWVPMVEDIRG